ncbi:MAG: ABC transporter ATP-binding protein [Candidatus Jorgensenbacteria bacterium]
MIRTENITKVYRTGFSRNPAQTIETPALKDVSFAIEDGEFVAIMGPSGSGKSTLMHIIGCLDTPTGGRYFLDGRDVSGFSDDELADIRNRKIGFVFQSFNLLPRATVMRNVMLPLVYAGVSRQKREEEAIKALSDSAFPQEFWNYRSNELSGGMMQRVAIARALVNNPKLILADEPTGNLDTETGEIVLGTFQRLHREQGRTVVLITHELHIAEHAERIIHIRDGKVVDDDKAKNHRLIKNHSPSI